MNRREGEAIKRPPPPPPQCLGLHISEKTWWPGDIEFARPAHPQHGDAVCEGEVDGRLRGEVAEPEGLKGLRRRPRSQRRGRPESSPHRLPDAEATRVAAAECESDAFLFETVSARSRIVQMVTSLKATRPQPRWSLENFGSPLP